MVLYHPQNIRLSNAHLTQYKLYLSPSSNLFDEIQNLICEIDSYSLSEVDTGEAFPGRK